jgi:hypothetical protein
MSDSQVGDSAVEALAPWLARTRRSSPAALSLIFRASFLQDVVAPLVRAVPEVAFSSASHFEFGRRLIVCSLLTLRPAISQPHAPSPDA